MSDIYQIVTGNEDPALWWLTFVEQMVREYGQEHNWQLDDDPQATHEAIGFVKDGCTDLRIHLQERQEDEQRRLYEQQSRINEMEMWGPADRPDPRRIVNVSSTDIPF